MQVVVKLSTTGSGPPVREPMFNEEERKAMMMAEHRRREEVLLRVFVFVLETEKKPTNLNGWHRHGYEWKRYETPKMEVIDQS